MMSDRIAEWLTTDPSAALEVAEEAAQQQIPGRLGVCVAAIFADHGRDKHPDPNIHELAYTLLSIELGRR